MEQVLDASRYKDFLNGVEHLIITCNCADDAILCACLHVCVFVYVYICVCVCVCVHDVCIRALVCVCICVYVWTCLALRGMCYPVCGLKPELNNSKFSLSLCLSHICLCALFLHCCACMYSKLGNEMQKLKSCCFFLTSMLKSLPQNAHYRK